jgi:MoaA/NifB/PqqE/SkfB family radical SAM enzyme
MKNIKHIVTTSKEYQIEVEWMITQRCNYECTYCASYNNSGNFMFKSLEEYITAFKYLSNHFGNKTIKLSFLGGEPMLYKQWPELVNYISELNYLPKITTNLSIPVKSYINKLNKNLGKFIVASWHPEYATNEFMNNVQLLNDNNFIRSVSVSAPQEYWNEAIEVLKTLKLKYGEKFVHLTRIKDENSQGLSITDKLIDYTSEQEKYFTFHRDYPVEIKVTDITNKTTIYNKIDAHNIKFKGMNCAVGKDSIHITPNGDVYPSACLLNYRKARMGNIYRQDIIKPTSSIRCPFVACYCGPDQRIEKWA